MDARNVLLRSSVAAAIILGAQAAAAGLVSVTPGAASYSVGQVATFTVRDDGPSDMVLEGYLFGSFQLDVDPTLLKFVGATFPSSWTDTPALVDVVGEAVDPVLDDISEPIPGRTHIALYGSVTDLSAIPTDLFTVSFMVLAVPPTSELAGLQVSPTQSLDGSVPIYDFDEPPRTTIEVTAAVPEPSTYALMAAGLAGVGFAARRRQRQAA